MPSPIPINLVFEDDLGEAVARRILQRSPVRFVVGAVYPGHGFGNIRRRLTAFNNAAKGMPYFVLVDSDDQCPPAKIRGWLASPVHPNLLFRIAVMEVESWLLADRSGIASFLGIDRTLIPRNADQIADPKRFLVNLARKSRRRRLREAIVPRPRTTAQVGPDYNGQLSSFIANTWNPRKATNNSASLLRCLKAVDNFQPTWPTH
jgi:hypothetical protein